MSLSVRTLPYNLIFMVLSILLVVEVFSVTVTPISDESEATSSVLRISDIDGPRIDERAASVVVDAPVALPVELFGFLFLVYVALLVFNFSYTFETVTSPQWRFETLLTLLVLFAWQGLDPERAQVWFPFLVLKSGLIIFVIYCYLWEKGVTPSPESIAGDTKNPHA
jgi:hypothetical protein